MIKRFTKENNDFSTALSSAVVFHIILANSTKMCYTYDSVGKVLSRTVKKLSDGSVISTETFTYDAAGNVTDAPIIKLF